MKISRRAGLWRVTLRSGTVIERKRIFGIFGLISCVRMNLEIERAFPKPPTVAEFATPAAEQARLDAAVAAGWLDIHGGAEEGGLYWRGINPETGRVEEIPKEEGGANG